MSAVICLGARSVPLPPVGLIAFGDAAHTLARRALEEGLAEGRTSGPWLAVASLPEASLRFLALLTRSSAGNPLPWVDGGMYLGRSPESEDLLLPTRRRVVLQATGETVDERLVAQALLRTGKGPIALVENKCIIHSISMHHALPIQNLTLATWLETERKSRVPSPSEAP